MIIEWGSDIEILKEEIQNNLKFGPKTIQANLRMKKQEFKLTTIKEMKKQIIDELYPRDHKVAFDPNNCLIIGAKDKDEDNLLKFSGKFPRLVKLTLNQSSLCLNEFYIFASSTMMLQLENSRQWFIDGTFSIAPMGFQ